MKRKAHLPALTFWLLAAAAVFVLWTRPGRGEEAAGVCTIGPPCTAWTVTLPERFDVVDHPVLVLRRCFDCERPAEGDLRINDQSLPLFDALGVEANDAREVRISYEVLSGWWRAGANTIAVTWRTQQDPRYHEIRELSVEFPDPPPAHIPAGCRRASRPPTAEYWITRYLRGCADGQGHETTEVAELTPEHVRQLWADARALMANEPIAAGPAIDIPWRASTDGCDVATLWGPGC